MNRYQTLDGAGLGLRRALLGPFENQDLSPVSFMEVAPENWINVGGWRGKAFAEYAEKRPMILHGLSLSIGGPAPLDETFLAKVRQFMCQHKVPLYSEHLSYCTDNGHLYDLMPIPFTEEAVHYVAARIRRTQDIIEQRIALENVSYYAAPGQEMSEIAFINAVLEEADCDLLLDVNNVYVNSINHHYDPVAFLQALPGERIAYGHIAGHYNQAEDLIIDTHGTAVINNVWDLLGLAYKAFGVFPTLLERDFNFPPVAELLAEVEQIVSIQNQWQKSDEHKLKSA
ncbi:MAG: DUF692 domain-containing protein [Xanthomonadales bacterium]|nr:DUF692 domain-containing protein [Xanthomonadales bacterium]